MGFNSGPTLSLGTEAQIASYIGQFKYDPYGFVMAVFPWGKADTALAKKTGPERWQSRFLKDLGAFTHENAIRKEIGLDYKVWQSAVSSGHGVGKSALVAWLILWLMSTRPDFRGTTTANTGNQLETKTWPELSKWHQLALNREWFQWTATSFFFKKYPEEKRKSYMMSALTVSDHNTEAFAGLHNESSAVAVIMDEAGGIEGGVWSVIDGAMTDGEPFIFCFGNPTRPEGSFFDCFNKHGHMFYKMQVDSRTVTHTNKEALQMIIDKHGADSDDAKIRVYGQFPEKSYNGLITMSMLHDAVIRELFHDSAAPRIMGIDVARFGRDKTVMGFRQGRDFRSFPIFDYQGLDNVKAADLACIHIATYKPDAICIESVGPGVGVIDILRSRRYVVTEVHPGSAAVEHERYVNKRTEMWAKARDWIANGGCMMENKELFADLSNIQYSLDLSENRMRLETKESMRERGLSSPDFGDMFALTFAVKVVRKDARVSSARNTSTRAITEYDPLTYGVEQ